MVILMRTSLNKRLYVIIGAIMVIGVIVGIIFVLMLDESTKEIIFLNINDMIQNISNTHINNIIIHLLILSTLLILSIFVIGAPLIIFFLFYNGFSIGFIISTITLIFGIKGLLFGLIYVIISKGIYILFLILFSNTLIKIVKNIIDKFINKGRGKDILIRLGRKALLCIGFVALSDIILYFGGIPLINVFNFLLN